MIILTKLGWRGRDCHTLGNSRFNLADTPIIAITADVPCRMTDFGTYRRCDSSTGASAVKGDAAVRYTHRSFLATTRLGTFGLGNAHQGGSISPLMIFTICDASANSVSVIAKVTLTRLSLGRSSSIDNLCGVKSMWRNRK
jgi:hypothetical protein